MKNGLCLAWKYARILFFLQTYIHTLSVPRGKWCSESLSLRKTVNFEEQIMSNWRRSICPWAYFLAKWRLLCWLMFFKYFSCGFENWGFPSFSWDTFSHMTYLDQSSKNIWWIVTSNIVWIQVQIIYPMSDIDKFSQYEQIFKYSE